MHKHKWRGGGSTLEKISESRAGVTVDIRRTMASEALVKGEEERNSRTPLDEKVGPQTHLSSNTNKRTEEPYNDSLNNPHYPFVG